MPQPGTSIQRYSLDLAAARRAQAEDASRLSRLMSELEVRDLLQVVHRALQAFVITIPYSRGGHRKAVQGM
jgi:hypothetical protein